MRHVNLLLLALTASILLAPPQAAADVFITVNKSNKKMRNIAPSRTMDRKSEVIRAQHPELIINEPNRSFEEARYQTFGDFQPNHAYDRFQ